MSSEWCPREKTVALLRAISQTCVLLRELALPRLWSAVHLCTIEELGRLREVLRVSPSVASHVGSFSLAWDMDGGYIRCDGYDSDYGDLLDFAFRDRLALWESLREPLGPESDHASMGGESDMITFSDDNGRTYDAPGHAEVTEGVDSEGNETVVFLYDAPRTGGGGPDGRGEDELIKDAEQLLECVHEVIAQFKSLETFGWAVPVMTIPDEVFYDTLVQRAITSLHLDLSDRDRFSLLWA